MGKLKKTVWFKQFFYKDRLLVLMSVDTLERRRLFYDLSLFYKVVHGFVDLSLNFDLRGTTSSRNTRGHDLKLRKELCKSDVAKFFFSTIESVMFGTL